MTKHRFYQDSPFDVNARLLLNEQVASHVLKVLRLRLGDEICLFDGRGCEAIAVIAEVGKKKVWVNVLKAAAVSRESSLSLHLLQGLSKGERMDWVVQKAVELGVSELTPLITERTVVKIDEKRMQKKLSHWARIIESASEQSGRNTLMVLNPPLRFEQGLKQESQTTRLFLDPLSQKTLKQVAHPTGQVVLMIGPEGGFSDKEREQAMTFKYEGICLGPRILRTETAAISACTLAQYQWGDYV